MSGRCTQPFSDHFYDLRIDYHIEGSGQTEITKILLSEPIFRFLELLLLAFIVHKVNKCFLKLCIIRFLSLIGFHL